MDLEAVSPGQTSSGPSSSPRCRDREEEEAAGLTASPLGGSEPSFPPSWATLPPPSSVPEQVQRDMFHTECLTRAGVPVTGPARGKESQSSQCCFTSTSLMHSVLKKPRHAHPGSLPRALSSVAKHMKKSNMLKNRAPSAITQPVETRVSTAVMMQMSPSPRSPVTEVTGHRNGVCFTLRPQGGAKTPYSVEWPVSALSLRMKSWATCTQSAWVLRTLEKGYRLQFSVAPPHFKEIVYSRALGESASFLLEEISTLRDKGAIRVVPPEEMHSGFYSRYFLVPKKGGRGMRAILDLRALNRHLRTYKFRMLTHASLLRFVRAGDWFTSIDLRDAYFHIPIYPPHRKYLRFAFQGIAYEFVVLPFGLSLSPRVFVKCTEAAVAPLRKKGIRVATYIDDWLVAAPTRQGATCHTNALIHHLESLGFQINVEKSTLTPTQCITFIGLSLDSLRVRAFLSPERTAAIQSSLALFRRGNTVTLKQCQRLLGLMASSLVAITLGRLHMRGFQRWVGSRGLDPHRDGHRRVRVSADCSLALREWKRPGFLSQGVAMGAVSARKVISTDASLSGWGATHEGRTVNGEWGPHMRSTHINCLELLAVHLSLKHFLPWLRGHHVLVRSDNSTVVAYINRQGGLGSPKLHTLAHRLIVWSSVHLLSLRATHVPGILNFGADLLSRGNPLYGDWKLHPEVVKQIWLRFGQATVDVYASRENAQCPLFYSLHDQRAPLGVDALAHEWPRTLLYAFPPVALISPTLARVRERSHYMILIAPHWPGKHWLAEIFQQLCGPPWPLPLRRDLLSQAQGEIFHPHPERLALWAWPVSGLT